jgi:hypothetical protein
MRAPLLAVLLAAALPARASLATGTGGAVAQFLRLGAGARSLGMGEAVVAAAEGPEAVFWNPAAMSAARHYEFSYARSELPASVHHDFAAGVIPAAWSGGTFGVAFSRLSQSPIASFNNAGVESGSISPHSEAISFGYARSFVNHDDRTLARGYFRDTWNLPGAVRPFDEEDDPWTGEVAVGAAVKAVTESVGRQKSATTALDAGALFRPYHFPSFALAAAVRNAGGTMRFIREKESLPTEFSLGAAHEWRLERDRVVAALEGSVPRFGEPYGKLGAEWDRRLSRGVRVQLRGGFQGRSAAALGALSGLTAGVGARLGGFSADFAFQPLGELGQSFRLGVGWRFGLARKDPF